MTKFHQHISRANLQQFGGQLVLVLLALVPFHALLVVWGGSMTGQGELLSVWKELIILVIAGLASFLILSKLVIGKSKQWRLLVRQPAVALVGLILLAGLLASIVNASYGKAFLVGVKTTVVPLVLFLAVQPFAKSVSGQKLTRVILGSAVVVAVLALIQFFVVPTGFLASIGYNSATILSFQGVHPGFPFGRTFSTLGGPNQLGTYLIIPSAIALAFAVRGASRQQRLIGASLFVLFILAMITTFSRSALVGLGVAVAITVLLAVPRKYRLTTILIFMVIGLGAGLIIWSALTNSQTTIFDRFLVRGDLTATGLLGGDEGHITALVQGYTALVMHPGGLGFGAAGPASFYAVRTLLTENWYLQIAIEVGLIGLGLMLLLLAHIVRRVRQLEIYSPLRIGYVGAVLGVMVSALFLHSLADSTLAIILFGVGGLLYAAKLPKEGNVL